MDERFETELSVRKKWLKEAEGMTLERLPAFLQKLVEFPHDYGSICRAIAAAGVAAAYAIEKSPAGGITGFQAGCVKWDLLRGWDSSLEGKPLRLVDYSEMLYPQYENQFQKTITKDAWKYLQAEAKKNLKRHETANPNVVAHWKSIVAGRVPFGYSIAEG